MSRKVNAGNLLAKGAVSAFAGYPIAFLMNLMILPFLMHWVEWNWFLGTLALGVPYFGASVARMFLIDYTWEKYNINIDPSYYIKNFLKRRFQK